MSCYTAPPGSLYKYDLYHVPDPESHLLYRRVLNGTAAETNQVMLVERMFNNASLNFWVLNEWSPLVARGSRLNQAESGRLAALVQRSFDHSDKLITDMIHVFCSPEAERPPMWRKKANDMGRAHFIKIFMMRDTQPESGGAKQEILGLSILGLDFGRFAREFTSLGPWLGQVHQAQLAAWMARSEEVSRTLVTIEQGGNSDLVTVPVRPTRFNRDPQPSAVSGNMANEVNAAQHTLGAFAQTRPARKAAPAPDSLTNDQLIERLAGRGATQKDADYFQTQVLGSAAFRQLVDKQIRLWTSAAHTGKRKRLQAALIKAKGTVPTTESTAKSQGAISTAKQSASETPPNPKSTGPSWEKQYARYCNKKTEQLRQQCAAVKALGKVIHLSQVPPLARQGIETMHKQARNLYEDEKKGLTQPAPTGGRSPTDLQQATRALEQLHRQYARLSELQMLATFSGNGVFEQVEKIVDQLT